MPGMRGIPGRNTLITGAASGIGRATAMRLAEEGAPQRIVVGAVRALLSPLEGSLGHCGCCQPPKPQNTQRQTALHQSNSPVMFE